MSKKIRNIVAATVVFSAFPFLAPSCVSFALTQAHAEDKPSLRDMYLGSGEDINFSKEQDHTNNPDDIAAHIFGSSVKAKDIMTAEDVIKQISKLKNASEKKLNFKHRNAKLITPTLKAVI